MKEENQNNLFSAFTTVLEMTEDRGNIIRLYSSEGLQGLD